MRWLLDMIVSAMPVNKSKYPVQIDVLDDETIWVTTDYGKRLFHLKLVEVAKKTDES